jgi:hypothetical protein
MLTGVVDRIASCWATTTAGRDCAAAGRILAEARASGVTIPDGNLIPACEATWTAPGGAPWQPTPVTSPFPGVAECDDYATLVNALSTCPKLTTHAQHDLLIGQQRLVAAITQAGQAGQAAASASTTWTAAMCKNLLTTVTNLRDRYECW